MGSCKLHLHFSRGPSHELFRLHFRDERGVEVCAVRGKSDGAHGGAGSFQWTSAVRALALLALQTRLLGAADGALSGERGSTAAALDFALGKPPRWLQELFGSHGQRVSRYFKRSNPELKQSGPVTVRFNERFVDRSDISVAIQGEPVERDEALVAILKLLGGEVVAAATDTSSPLEEDVFKRYLSRIIAEETLASLSRVRFTSPSWCRGQLGSLAADDLFRKITRAPQDVAQALLPPSGSAERFAVRRDALLQRWLPNGLRLLAPSCQPALISLASYLRDYLGVPLQLDPYHLYGIELVDRVLRENGSSIPTLISTGLGPSTPLLNDPRHGYKPIMLGPALSHRIVSTGRARTQPISEIYMVAEQTTSAMFSLANFMRSGAVKSKNALRHIEPDEVMQHIGQGESLHSLLWFPHNRFFPDFVAGDSLVSSRDEPYVDVTIIFGNEAITSNPRLLGGVTAAIRHAWLGLLDSPPTVATIAAGIVADGEFYTYLRRSLGLHYAPGFTARVQSSSNVLHGVDTAPKLSAPLSL